MPNDNTLGAPTEGLGQNVTFTASGGRVPQTQAGQRGALRTNSTGGGAMSTARAMQVPAAQPDATFAVLAKLGGDLLKPHLEAERNAAYVQGMQQAAQGQAIAEIVDEQPWYSKMFGSTSLVDGARAYTANTKATAMAIELETNMGELRKLSPGEFASQTTKRLTNASTGDATTDMMFQQQVGQVLPSAFKTQAKEHLRYNAEVLGDGIEESAYTSLKRVVASDAAYRDPARVNDDGDLVAHELAAIGAFVPPEGMPQEEFLKRTSNAVIRAVNEGGHAAYDLVKTSGIYDKFTPSQQAALETAKVRARQRSILGLPLEFSQELFAFKRSNSDPATTQTDITERAAAVNAKYYELTGDQTPYVDANALAGELDAWQRGQDRLVRQSHAAIGRATTEQAKAQAKVDAANSAVVMALGGGNVGVLLDGKEDKQNFWAAAEGQLGKDPAKLAMLRVDQQNKDNPDATFKTKLQGMILTGASSSPALLYDAYLNHYLPLVQQSGDRGEAVAQFYAGDGGKYMVEMHKVLGGKAANAVDIEVAYKSAVIAGQRDTKAPATATAKAAKEFSSNPVMSMWHNLPGDDFAVRNPTGLAQAVAPFLRSDLPDDESAQAALSTAVNRGTVSLLGGYHWDTLPTNTSFKASIASASQLHQQTPGSRAPNSDELNRAFVMAVDKAKDSVGIDEGLKVMQISDSSGQPRVIVTGSTADGKFAYRVLTPSEVVDTWSKRVTFRDSMSTPKMVPGPAPKYGPHSMKQ